MSQSCRVENCGSNAVLDVEFPHLEVLEILKSFKNHEKLALLHIYVGDVGAETLPKPLEIVEYIF